jgi:membrane fusion protein (multidrug efflux system)
MRRCLFLLVALALLAACAAGEPAQTDNPAVRVAVPVRVVVPQIQDVTEQLCLPAELLPMRRATLAAEVPGTVETLAVEDGQRVRAGEVLLTVDTRSLEQAVAEAEAVFRQRQLQYERTQRLFDRQSVTTEKLIDANAAREVAEAQLGSARLQLEKSRVKAPWAGQVSRRKVEVGDYVVPGQPVVELLQVDRLKVRAPASAGDVPFLEVGIPAVIRVDGLPDESFEGRVVRLAPELTPEARTLAVEVEIPNPDGRLKPGMLARMDVPRRKISQALVVPLQAVVDLGEEQAVYIVEDRHARRRLVELGPVIGEQVVVEEGLRQGEPVVVEGKERVSDGQLVSESG